MTTGVIPVGVIGSLVVRLGDDPSGNGSHCTRTLDLTSAFATLAIVAGLVLDAPDQPRGRRTVSALENALGEVASAVHFS